MFSDGLLDQFMWYTTKSILQVKKGQVKGLCLHSGILDYFHEGDGTIKYDFHEKLGNWTALAQNFRIFKKHTADTPISLLYY